MNIELLFVHWTLNTEHHMHTYVKRETCDDAMNTLPIVHKILLKQYSKWNFFEKSWILMKLHDPESERKRMNYIFWSELHSFTYETCMWWLKMWHKYTMSMARKMYPLDTIFPFIRKFTHHILHISCYASPAQSLYPKPKPSTEHCMP